MHLSPTRLWHHSTLFKQALRATCSGKCQHGRSSVPSCIQCYLDELQALSRLQAEEGQMDAVRSLCTAYLDAWAKLHPPVAFMQASSGFGGMQSQAIVRADGPMLGLLLSSGPAQQLQSLPQDPSTVRPAQQWGLKGQTTKLCGDGAFSPAIRWDRQFKTVIMSAAHSQHALPCIIPCLGQQGIVAAEQSSCKDALASLETFWTCTLLLQQCWHRNVGGACIDQVLVSTDQ